MVSIKQFLAVSNAKSDLTSYEETYSAISDINPSKPGLTFRSTFDYIT